MPRSPTPPTHDRRRDTSRPYKPTGMQHRAFGDTRKIHPLGVPSRPSLIPNGLGQTATLFNDGEAHPPPACVEGGSNLSRQQELLGASKPPVPTTERGTVAKARGPKTRQFTEGQLEMLDTQVEREVRKKTDAIYHILRKRFYPDGEDKVVFEAAATSHRFHSAYRAAISQVDVTAIRSRVAHRLETMVTGGDHSEEVGFDFLLNIGAAGSGEVEQQQQQGEEKEKEKDGATTTEAAAAEDDENGEGAEGGSGKRKSKKLRGAALWRYIVRKKHWKALVPYQEPAKPWEQLKFVRLPTHKIDIRTWTRNRRAKAEAKKQARLGWMREQWSRGRGGTGRDAHGGGGGDGDDDLANAEARTAAMSTPAYRVLKNALAAYTTKLGSASESVATLDKKSWGEIVASLQAQGVLGRNFHLLWEPMAHPFPSPPFSSSDGSDNQSTEGNAKVRSEGGGDAVGAGDGASPETHAGDTDTNRATSATTTSDSGEHPAATKPLASAGRYVSRLGRYLLPNRNLVNPNSKGTLDDYYGALSSRSPEMMMPRVASAFHGDDSATFGRRRRLGPSQLHGAWFAVPTGHSPDIDPRSTLRKNNLRAEESPKGGSEAMLGMHLGGVHSAGPASALPMSAFAPHAWNSSRVAGSGAAGRKSGRKGRRKKNKKKMTTGTGTGTEGGGSAVSDNAAESGKVPRWATFLPAGAAVGDEEEGSGNTERDATIRRNACQTFFMGLSRTLHHQRAVMLDVRSGGGDATVEKAVAASNPMVRLHRGQRKGGGGGSGGGGGGSDTRSGATSPGSSSPGGGGGRGRREKHPAISPVTIPGTSHRNVVRLLHHLKDYVDLGPERLHVPFCPKDLGRLLARVEAAAVRRHKKDTDTHKKGPLAKVATSLAPSPTRRRGGRGGRQRARRRGIIAAPAVALDPPTPMPFAVADNFVWSTEMLHYNPRLRLGLLTKYAKSPWCYSADAAATLWRRAAVAIDRLEGLAYEISRRADAPGRVGSVSRFHAVEAKQISRWNVLTLLNEFDMTSCSVRGLLTMLFVRFHDCVEWRGEFYLERMGRIKAVMRRELASGGGGVVGV